ncbi:hypothetical protein D6745_00235 [Candidatus Woesearchaeota archaeon]|nr:MAG: hypothetical protein D6745_00235 [Candidatus Woesearchaeota archaeon]
MVEGIQALIVGCGRFGKNYARILSGLAKEEVFAIESITITRTTAEAAAKTAAELSEATGFPIHYNLVRNRADLADLLSHLRPEFTAVTAKDSAEGDSIHLPYSFDALNYGIVLCEKPLSNATGDGSSLHQIKEWRSNPELDKTVPFSLELPMAVVSQKIMENPELADRFQNAKKIVFYWVCRGTGRPDVIDNLVLHPWSLIPEDYKLLNADVNDKGETAHINLGYLVNGRHVNVEINLAYGGNFTGFSIDGFGIGIKRTGVLNEVIRLENNIEDALCDGNDLIIGKPLVDPVENPLGQHIVSSLQGKRIVGPRRTYQSQHFLETLKGYKGI